jgi:hypothetical protein
MAEEGDSMVPRAVSAGKRNIKAVERNSLNGLDFGWWR